MFQQSKLRLKTHAASDRLGYWERAPSVKASVIQPPFMQKTLGKVQSASKKGCFFFSFMEECKILVLENVSEAFKQIHLLGVGV